MFMGNTSENFETPLTSQGEGNERFGWMFAPAGDVNDDGYADTFIGQEQVSRHLVRSICILDPQTVSHQPLKPYERGVQWTILVL